MCRILVVDDEPDVQKTLVGILTDAGYTTQPAANEGEALATLVRETFDFVLMDIRLHGGGGEDESGLSLAMAFRALNPQVRIIILSRYVRQHLMLRTLRYYGVVDFIEKTPDMGEQVLKTIAEARRETKWPRFEKTREATRLSLLLAAERPLTIRARGRYVCATYTPQTLQISVERYARKADIARRDPANLRFHVEDIGRGLWHDIFDNPEANTAYLEARAKSRSLSLLFETSRELLSLPLEFMRSNKPSEYLVLQHPLARFVCEAMPQRPVISPQLLALTKKLRILIIASNTQPPIPGVDGEAKKLCDHLRQQDYIPVDVKFIPTEQATYQRVKEELRWSNYDIIHYAGHGSYNPKSPEESSISFWASENKQGRVVPMKAAELTMLLRQSEARLVYLSSCYGTATGDQAALLDDDFLGLADAVAQAGVPTVLGFRWPVSDAGARKLALAFYRSLLEQGGPEIALWSARCELAALDRNDPTWLSPILIHQE